MDITKKPGKVLVVEDNPMNRELVTDILEAGGHVVLSAETAEEGIQVARHALPALILMDIALPGMDGLTATAALKRDPITRAIPVIALTAQAMKGDAEKAYAVGCTGYITKPINTRTFQQTVYGFLQFGAAFDPETAPANPVFSEVSKPAPSRPTPPRKPPVRAASPSVAAAPAPHHVPLVVIAAPDSEASIAPLIEETGYRTHTTSEMGETLKTLSAEVDLIVLGMSLTDVSGPDFARRLRAESRFKQLPILLVLPPETPQAVLENAVESGVSDCLPLPIDPLTLRLRIQTMLTLREAQREAERSHSEMRRTRLEATEAHQQARRAQIDMLNRLAYAAECHSDGDDLCELHLHCVSQYVTASISLVGRPSA